MPKSPPNSAGLFALLASFCGLWLAALMSWCSLTHYCMCGHLQHPPWAESPPVSDVVWLVLLGLAPLLAAASNLPAKKFFYGSLVGAELAIASFPPFAMVPLVVLAIVSLVGLACAIRDLSASIRGRRLAVHEG